MNVLWIVSVLAVVRGATVQTGNVQWFDLEAAQKHPEHLHILKAKAGINYQPYEQAWTEFRILFSTVLLDFSFYLRITFLLGNLFVSYFLFFLKKQRENLMNIRF